MLTSHLQVHTTPAKGRLCWREADHLSAQAVVVRPTAEGELGGAIIVMSMMRYRKHLFDIDAAHFGSLGQSSHFAGRHGIHVRP